ncbi:MAG: 4Fe-4S dicluster domain-containing protein [Nitrospirae bacterium]|nr:4Fe-4S dicluster domain-containing protein [Nitrospirota bacterium]MBF0542120.1 4Fe-4S dicluster domain-containing protein [Nitrospirota bacterium]
MFLLNRRRFLNNIWQVLTITLISFFSSNKPSEAFNLFASKDKKFIVRPPAAIAENVFIKTCISCHLCGQACPNDCIKYIDDPFSPGLNDTPYIKPREKGCILCMKCTQVCPTGALRYVPNDEGDTIQKYVKMGIAVVDKNICKSYNKQSCGVCIRACPFADVAIIAETWERPVVINEKCVGCGLCEQACIHFPQAIRVKSVSVAHG